MVGRASHSESEPCKWSVSGKRQRGGAGQTFGTVGAESAKLLLLHTALRKLADPFSASRITHLPIKKKMSSKSSSYSGASEDIYGFRTCFRVSLPCRYTNSVVEIFTNNCVDDEGRAGCFQ